MNDTVSKDGFQQYLAEARSWETDKVLSERKSRRTAWIVAAAATAVAFTEAVALGALVPLKQVEPYVIRVDNSTGIVDVVNALPDGKTNYEEAINKYFTQKYVKYREGYSRALAEDYYYNVGLMSGTVEQQRFFQFFTPKNPLSPLNVYGEHAKVHVTIKSTSFISPTVALVRYVREVQRGANITEVSHWAATVSFAYNKAPMKEQDRAVNPLGFQVIEYRNDPETTAAEGTLRLPPVPVEPRPSAAVTVFPDVSTPQAGVQEAVQ